MDTTTATKVLDQALLEAKKSLYPFGIPIRVNTNQPVSGEFRPYLSTFYNAGSLEDINVIAYTPELHTDSQHLTEEEYKIRLITGFKEEIIHCIQLVSAKLRFSRLNANQKAMWGTACAYYNRLQQELFNELAATEHGSKLLIAAGKLYYANPLINTIEQLRANDISEHSRVGYITVELIRQIVQIRLGEVTSEEGRKKTWDKNNLFAVGASLEELAATIKEYAPNPSKVSNLLAEIIGTVEELL